MKKIAFVFYYYFAQYLPKSNSIILGKISKYIRVKLFKMYTNNTSSNLNIQRRAVFSSKITIGNNSGIGSNSQIQGPTVIGDNVMMGPDVIIYTTNHETSNINIPMIEQGFARPKQVIIGNDVWIGSRVTILPGVRVGDGAIIGASALVTKDVEPYSVVGGNPANVLKSRKF